MYGRAVEHDEVAFSDLSVTVPKKARKASTMSNSANIMPAVFESSDSGVQSYESGRQACLHYVRWVYFHCPFSEVILYWLRQVWG